MKILILEKIEKSADNDAIYEVADAINFSVGEITHQLGDKEFETLKSEGVSITVREKRLVL